MTCCGVKGEQRLKRIDKRVAPLSVAALLLGPCFHRVLIRQAMGRDLLPSKDGKFVTALVQEMVRGLGVSR